MQNVSCTDGIKGRDRISWFRVSSDALGQGAPFLLPAALCVWARQSSERISWLVHRLWKVLEMVLILLVLPLCPDGSPT